MATLTEILIFFSSYSYLVSFLGAFLGGEETVMLLAVLSTQGYFHIWIVFVFCFLGIMVSDSMWFFIGKTELITYLREHRFISKGYDKLTGLLDKVTNGKGFLALLYTKFFYGARIVTIMYLSRKKMNFKDFISYSFIINLMWTFIAVCIGVLAGKGFTMIMSIFKNFKLAIVYLIIIAILFLVVQRLLRMFVSKWLIKKREQ